MKKKKRKKNPGGRPSIHGISKVTLSLRVTPAVKRFLMAQESSASECVDSLIKSTKMFQEFIGRPR